LCGGWSFGAPASDLLRIDIDELELLAVDTLDPGDGDVVEEMGVVRAVVSVRGWSEVSLSASSIMLATSGSCRIGCQFTGSPLVKP
jgi:hypothetical protein